MATNHLERRGITPPAIYKQQFFVLCGPPPARNRKALPRFLQKHWLASIIVLFFGVFLTEKAWAMYDYAGATMLYAWRCELLAGGLALLTICLYRTFRRWGIERRRRVVTRREHGKEINVLLCTPPPLSPAIQPISEPEFAITIERWTSHKPTEESLTQTTFSDELIAPDALVLKVEVKKAA